jgi:hypothetical protein
VERGGEGEEDSGGLVVVAVEVHLRHLVVEGGGLGQWQRAIVGRRVGGRGASQAMLSRLVESVKYWSRIGTRVTVA